VSENDERRGRGRDPWWDDVEDEIIAVQDTPDGESGGDLPDPWASVAPAVGELTAEQAAFLAGLEDQPAVPRLSGISGPDETGDDAGDTAGDTGDDAGSV